MKKYRGQCHCGAVTFDVKMDLTSALECNCSHCFRKGFLLAFLPKSQFTLLSGSKHLTRYQFHKKKISHLFCNICGTQSFGMGKSPDGTDTVAINIRCLEDIDVSKITITPIDGKAF